MPVLKKGKKKGKNGVYVGNDFCDSKIHATVWLAYKDQVFWKDLWRNKKNKKALQNLLEKTGFRNALALRSTEIKRLQKSLNRRNVKPIAPRRLMAHLHTFTRPQRNIDASWVEW